MKYERVYVLECETRNKNGSYLYVGTTFRIMSERLAEHEEGWGSRWTAWHGYKRLLCACLVPEGTSNKLENELTRHLMAEFGWGNVRGGNYVFVRCKSKFWLPPEFRALGPRDVLPLHLRPVSKFPSELLRLIDAFQVGRGFQHPDELDPDPLAEPVLGGVAQERHHVGALHPVSVALRAK